MKKILLSIFIIILTSHFYPIEAFAEENFSDEKVFNMENELNEEAEPIELHGYLEYSDEEQEAVYLDNDGELNKIKITPAKNIESKNLISGSKKPNFQPLQNDFEVLSKYSTQINEHGVSPVSTSYVKDFGKWSVGTTYNSFLSGALANYSTGVFTRYDSKRFALTTTFMKKTNNVYDIYSDRLFLAPEVKITKRLSLLDVMQTDPTQTNTRNEVVLRYTPHLRRYADDVQLEVGAGQSFYENEYINSSIRFSTRFKL